MFLCLHLHGTGATDGEGIRPETDAGTLMKNHGEEVSNSNLGQTESHPLSESAVSCLISHNHQFFIARMLNKDQKTALSRHLYSERGLTTVSDYSREWVSRLSTNQSQCLDFNNRARTGFYKLIIRFTSCFVWLIFFARIS